MKKNILISIIIILTIILVVINIDIPTKKPVVKLNIDKIYTEIAKNAYHGTLNFRDVYIVFRPLDYEGYGSKYECKMYEQENGEYFNETFYDVDIKDEDIIFTMTSGAFDFDVTGQYKNKTLIINGEKFESVDPNSLKYPAYYYYGDPSFYDEEEKPYPGKTNN